MIQSVDLGGTFTPAGTSLALRRIGYGAIHLTGAMAWGPPRDRQAALAVLREAVAAGINHIDTSDSTGRTSRTRSFARRSILIRANWSSLPRLAHAAVATNPGPQPYQRRT